MPPGSIRNHLFPAVCAVVLTVALGLAAATPVLAQPFENVRKICADPIARFERLERIPGQLLAAVALAESGRWDKARGAIFAWPWTVTAGGKGRFFATKAKAIAEVRRLRAAGVRNIDVGCMQINLMYHPDAFDDLDQAFDPAENVAYAARFLKRLNEARRSWSMAVGLYHSSNREFLYPYRRKVLKLWNQERHRVAMEKRQAQIEKYKKLRAERRRLSRRRRS
jgi:hypothetical protein